MARSTRRSARAARSCCRSGSATAGRSTPWRSRTTARSWRRGGSTTIPRWADSTRTDRSTPRSTRRGRSGVRHRRRARPHGHARRNAVRRGRGSVREDRRRRFDRYGDGPRHVRGSANDHRRRKWLRVHRDLSDDSEDATDVAVQDDGKIVIVGTWVNAAPDFVFFAARFATTMSLDPTFNAAGPTPGVKDVRETAAGSAVAVRPNGRIVAGGSAVDTPDFLAAQLLPNGTPDPSFGTSGLKPVDFPGAELLILTTSPCRRTGRRSSPEP